MPDPTAPPRLPGAAAMPRRPWRIPGRIRAVVVLVAALAICALAPAPLGRAQDQGADAQVSFDPPTGRLAVEVRMPAPGAGLAFDISPWIDDYSAEADGAVLLAIRAGDRLQVPATPAGRGLLTLKLGGTVPALDPGAPDVLPPAAASPEGSYLFGGSGWLPPLGPGYRLAVAVPEPYRAVATGRLESEATGGGTYRAVFAAEGAAEPPALFIGPYAVEERIADGLRLRTYFHRDDGVLSPGYLDSSLGYIRRYAELVGPYPYAGFSVVAAPVPVGLGFEGLTYVSRGILPLPFMRGRSLAHEVLHSWWGGGVAINYARGNWAEGLTAYMADYALAADTGAEAAREMRLEWLRNLSALPADNRLSVLDFVSKTHDRAQVIGYDKVALIFHMLRSQLGDAAFTDGLRLFWRAHRFGPAAGWADLRRAFETASGRDLGWFFDQWLTRAGLPRVELLRAERRPSGTGFELTLALRQDSPVYRLRLPVVIDTAGGALRTEIELTGHDRTVVIPVAERPRAVRLDPDFDVARRLLPGESPPIIRDITLAADPALVVATADPAAGRAAALLAGRLLQRDIAPVAPGGLAPGRAAVMVIGLTRDVEAFRARLLDGPPGAVTGAGSARGWVERDARGATWLFISADTADALEAIAKRLQHYRGRSFIVVDGGKVTRQGLWPVPDSPLSVAFD